MSTKQCPIHMEEMKKGFFYIRNNENAVFHNFVVWVEGEKSDITKFMGSNANAQQYPVTPYKCAHCGLIEHYADPVEKWRH